MRMKILILAMLASLSGCGVGKNDRNAAVVDTVELVNIKERANVVGVASNGYVTLGEFAIKDLPLSLVRLTTESEIGTLGLEFEEEIYSEKYEQEALPTLSSRMEKFSIPVRWLQKDFSTMALIVRDERIHEAFRVKEVPITVQSAKRSYCARAYFPAMVVAQGLALQEQSAACDLHGMCSALYRIDIPTDRRDSMGRAELSKYSHTCQEWQDHYDVIQAKVNRSTPRQAIIYLNGPLSQVMNKIKFQF